MKHKCILLCAALVLACAVTALETARANNGDITLIVRTGSNNTQTANLINTSGTNGTSVTTGSGLSICPTGPIVSSTSTLNTTGTLPGTTGTNASVGQLGLNASGQLIICGTAGNPGTWRVVP
jgi:hypothetical protein